MTLASLMLALLAAFVLPGDANPTPDQESTTRIYDLTDLGPGRVMSSYNLHLLPMAPQHDLTNWSEEDLVDPLLALIYDVVAPEEFEYEGRSLGALENDRLLVTAPEAIHERIATLLEGCRAAFDRRAQLDIRIFKLNRGRALPVDLPMQTLPGLVEQGVLRQVHVRREDIPMGTTTRVRNLELRSVVGSWSGEIAQHAATSDPSLRPLETGLDLGLRAEDTLNGPGLRIRYAVGLTRLRELETRVVEYPPAGSVVSKDIVQRVVSRAVDLPTTEVSQLVGSCVLQPGQGRVIRTHVMTHAGEETWVSLIRLRSFDAPVPTMAFGDSAVVVVDASAASWSGFRAPHLSVASMTGREGSHQAVGYQEFEEPAYAHFPAEESLDWFAEMETIAYSTSDWDDRFGSNEGISWGLGNWGLFGGPPQVLERRQLALRLLAGQRRGLTLRLSLTRPGGAGETAVEREVAGCSLAFETGSEALAIMGDSVTIPHGYNVEVATGAAIALPTQIMVLDGLAVHARAEASGAVELSVSSVQLQQLEDQLLHSHVPDSFDRPLFSTAEVRVRLLPGAGPQIVAELEPSLTNGASLRLRAEVILD
jgi:hypothetical protein